jgi:hypothetical protein
MHRRKTALLALTAMLALGVAACGDDDGDAADATTTTEAEEKGSDTIQIDYVDYAYQVSGPLTAGGTIELANKGDEFHMMAVAKLKPGKTLKDVQELVEQQFADEEGGDEGGSDGPSTTEDEASRAFQGDDTSTTRRSSASTSTTAGRSGGATASTSGDDSGEEGGGGEEEDPMAEVAEEVGVPGNFMSPGAEAAVTIPDLEPGTYSIMCFIPTEGEGTPHIAKGMINQFKVVEGEAPAEPTADVTYKVEAGKAVSGPGTLEAGEQTLKFEGVGDAGELEPALAKLDTGTTFAQLDKVLGELFEGEDPPAKGSAEKIPGDIIFGGFDFGDFASYYLTVTLEAGNHVIVAEDSDDEDDPATPKELLQIKVS